MTHEQQALWQRIRDFEIDAPDASLPFSSRLAQEWGWTPTYTARVVGEYRRFAFLSVAAGHGVTPSKAVDEAWHLHLLYTRNYWDGFCPQALGRPLHHNPSGGTAEDEAKYEGWYDDTLASYRRLFGEEPPGDVWPTAPMPARRSWFPLSLFAVFLTGCAEPANPLDWHGPAFLALFATLYGAAVVAACGLRRALSGPQDGPPAEEWRLHPNDQAYLNGGPTLALATALAHLTAQSAVEVDRTSGRIRVASPAQRADHPLDRAILRATDSPTGSKYEGVASHARPVLAEMEGLLRRQGLWTRADHLAPAILLPFALASMPLLLGIAKILVGLGRERPVGFLILGCVLGFMVNLLFLSPPRRSRYGNAVLGRLREARPNAQYAAYRSGLTPAELASGMALYGLGALDGGDYAYLRPAIVPQASASGVDGGSGCGSSSCGGGGGGCGGGCGGCGS